MNILSFPSNVPIPPDAPIPKVLPVLSRLTSKNNESSTKTTYKNYAKRFESLNNRSVTTGILAKIRRFILKFFSLHPFKWSTHMTVEYMGFGKLDCNKSHLVLKRIESLFKSIDSIPEKMRGAISYAKKISEMGSAKAASLIKKDIHKLKKGDFLAIPIEFQNHAMIMMITCTGEHAGKKIYKIEHHNEGLGVNEYHYAKTNAFGNELFQSKLEIVDIPEDKLCGKDSIFFRNLLNSYVRRPISTLYEELLPKLGGKIVPPSEDPRDWTSSQIGGSCTSACVKSMLRSHLQPQEYADFEERAAYEILLKSFEHIKSGAMKHKRLQKVATLEMITMIQYRFFPETSLPPELQKAKTQLEAMIEKDNAKGIKKRVAEAEKRVRALSKKDKKIRFFTIDQIQKHLEILTKEKGKGRQNEIQLNNIRLDVRLEKVNSREKPQLVSDSFSDNLNLGFTVLRDGYFSPLSIKLAEPYLEKAVMIVTDLSNSANKQMNMDELNKFLQCSELIIAWLTDRPKTMQTNYYLAAIATTLNKMKEYIEQHNMIDKTDQTQAILNKISEFSAYYHTKLNKHKGNLADSSKQQKLLGKGRIVGSRVLNELIEEQQRNRFKEKAVHSPLNMEKMLAEMRKYSEESGL